MESLELRHLRALISVARNGSVSAAARELGVAQPNLTRQLQRIEALLGVGLFARDAKGAVLTRAGAVLVERAERILADFDDFVELARRASGEWPSEVRIATYGIPVEVLRPFTDDRLRAAAWSVRETTPAEGVAAVRRGLSDLFVGRRWPHGGWPDTERLICVEVTRDPMTVVLPRSHPLAGDGPIDLIQLRGEAWVSNPRLNTTELECRRAGFKPDIRYLHADAHQYVRIISAGEAVAFAREGADIDPETPVVNVRYRDPSYVYTCMVFDPDRLQSDVADAFVRALLAKERRVQP